MSCEKKFPSNVCIGCAVMAVAVIISFSNFSKRTLKEIWRRYKREEGGNSGKGKHCAHYNHDRKYPGYDDPKNGRVLTYAEHYMDHYDRNGKPGLGLTKQQNKRALGLLWSKLSREERNKLPPPDSVS